MSKPETSKPITVADLVWTASALHFLASTVTPGSELEIRLRSLGDHFLQQAVSQGVQADLAEIVKKSSSPS